MNGDSLTPGVIDGSAMYPYPTAPGPADLCRGDSNGKVSRVRASGERGQTEKEARRAPHARRGTITVAT
jgi:hypothetical protein